MDEEQKIVQFAEVAKTIFAPAYPVVARQILSLTQVSEGLALDVGTGPGLLTKALISNSALKVIALDFKLKALEIARDFLSEVQDRLFLCQANVTSLPFKNNVFNLVVSRGSFFFWHDKALGLKEIFRVLRPQGKAVIGAGFGSLEIKRQIERQIKSVYPDWAEKVTQRFQEFTPPNLEKLAEQAGLRKRRVIYDEVNLWLMFEK